MLKMCSLLSFKFCLIFLVNNAFSQTQLYKSSFPDFNITDQKLYASLVMAENTIVFNASDFKLYGIDKTSYKTNWEINTGIKSIKPAILYKDTFFFRNSQSEETRVEQYDLKTGKLLKHFPFESLARKPHFIGIVMYLTG